MVFCDRCLELVAGATLRYRARRAADRVHRRRRGRLAIFARRRRATVYVGVPYFYCERPPAVIDRRCSRPAAADTIFTGPAKADRRVRTSVSVTAAPD